MMDRFTGRALDPNSDAHLVQSIGDILTTPIGSRVGRRTYGSILPELIDQPDSPLNRLRCFAATAGALLRWEPRVRLTRVAFASAGDGRASLRLTLKRAGQMNGPPFSLDVALRTA